MVTPPMRLTPVGKHLLWWSLALLVSSLFWTVLIAAYLVGQS